MSVVNKMLQDLEARQSQTDEIRADYQAPPKKQSKLLVLLLLILAIAAIIFALTDIDRLFVETNKDKITTNTQSSPSKVTTKMALASEKVQPETVQDKNIEEQTANTEIEIVTTTETEVALPTAVLADESILPQDSKEDAVSQLNPIQTVTTDKLIVTQTSSEITTQTAAVKPSSFSMTGSSQENNSSNLKQRITESLNNDESDQARSLLYELLEIEPDNIKARKKLASLLFAQGNYAQSKQLLVQGIELQPAQSDLRLMLARLYVVQKESSQALNLLADFQPSAAKQSEYLSYRAALAQQLKQTKLAKSDYQTLTNIESTNAKWWLGLGISEDQLGEVDKAILAYRRAISLEQLENSVNDFMQQRISVLAGAQ